MLDLKEAFSFYEFVGQIKFARNFLSQCIHSKCFGRIMTAGIEVETKFLGEIKVLFLDAGSDTLVSLPASRILFTALCPEPLRIATFEGLADPNSIAFMPRGNIIFNCE